MLRHIVTTRSSVFSRVSFCNKRLSRDNGRAKSNESSTASAEENRSRGKEELSVQFAVLPSQHQLRQYLQTSRKNPQSVTRFTTVLRGLEVVTLARDSPIATELCRPRPLKLIEKKVVGGFRQNLGLRRDAHECQQFVHRHFLWDPIWGYLDDVASATGRFW